MMRSAGAAREKRYPWAPEQPSWRRREHWSHNDRAYHPRFGPTVCRPRPGSPVHLRR
jgi:hypothetical protein